MNETEKQKITRFLLDEVMSGAVYGVIRDTFLAKKGPRDVQVLAAERLAVEMLNEAWKELSKYRAEVEEGKPILKQVGM